MTKHNGSIKQRKNETDEQYLKRLYDIRVSPYESEVRKEAAMIAINKKLYEM